MVADDAIVTSAAHSASNLYINLSSHSLLLQERLCAGELSVLLFSADGDYWAELPDGSDL